MHFGNIFESLTLNFSFIHQGIFLLEDLAKKHSEGNRDYVYYLAIGNVRIKEYSIALKFCRAFLQIEPNNQQAITLEVSSCFINYENKHHLYVGLHYTNQPFRFESNLQEHIRKKMEKETMAGVAVAGGAALVLGGLVGLGFALASASKK